MQTSTRNTAALRTEFLRAGLNVVQAITVAYVAFRSAKERPFAERKATIIFWSMLNIRQPFRRISKTIQLHADLVHHR